VYLARLSPLRKDNLNLFCSVANPARPISKNGLSFFIKKLILDAHQWLPSELHPICKVKAHDVRGVATSLAFTRNVAFDKILSAASWKSSSVFATYYLRDLSLDYGDCRSLGPIVSAGAVLT